MESHDWRKMNIDNLFFLVWVIIISLIPITILLALNDSRTIYEYFCEDMGGKVITYECYQSALVIYGMPYDCSKVKIGRYCVFPDGTEISEGNLTYIFNSTLTALSKL